MTKGYMENVKMKKEQITKKQTGLTPVDGYKTYFNEVVRGRKLIGFVTSDADIGKYPTRWELRDPSLHVHDVVKSKEEAMKLVAKLSLEQPSGWIAE